MRKLIIALFVSMLAAPLTFAAGPGRLLLGTGTDNGGDLQVSKDSDIQIRGTRTNGADGYVAASTRGWEMRTVNNLPMWLGTNNGTSMLFATSTYIGIGTETPLARLHVLGTGSSDSTIYAGDSTHAGCLVLGDSDGTGLTYVTANNGVLAATTTKPSACQ